MKNTDHSITAGNDTFLNNKTEYNAIDIMRFVCAILVISGHVAPFGYVYTDLFYKMNYMIIHGLARIAVPFFFTTSGFFLYRKTTLENFSFAPTKAYVLKLLRFYFIWTILYFPKQIGALLADEQGILHGCILYARDIVFAGSYTHLWYFPALIFAVLLVSFLLSKKVKLKYILTAATILYALGLLAQSWFGLIEPLRDRTPQIWSLLKIVESVIVTTRDGLFFGFLYVCIGAFIAFYGCKMQQKIAFSGIILFMGLFLVEVWGVMHFELVRETDMYFFAVPLTLCIFVFTLNYRIPRKTGTFRMMGALSTLMFFTHIWIKHLIRDAFHVMGIQIEKTCMLFVLTVIVSFAFSFILYKLSRDTRLKWLQKLYS